MAKYADAKDACSACYGSLIYALDRLNDAGELRGKKETICIGQAYRERREPSAWDSAPAVFRRA